MSRRKTKFNFLDALLILAVIALIAGAVWREELSDRLKTENMENTVTVCCEIEALADRDGSYAAEFSEDRTPVWMDGSEAGFVEMPTSVYSAQPPESSDSSGESAAPVAAQTLSGTKLYLKVVSRESGYYIGGETKLLIGGEYRLYTKTMEFTARILSVQEEQEG